MRKRPPKDGPVPLPVSPLSPLENRSVIDLILDLREKRVDPHILSAADRQACVAHLGAEGLSVAEIAQFLKCSDRTIFRDRQALQDAAALTHDPALAGRIAGQVMTEATVCMERILRLARDRSVPPQTRLEAFRACFPILAAKVGLLQSLGFLPTAAQQIDARLTHGVEAVPPSSVLAAEIERLRQIAQEDGGQSFVEVQAVEALAARAEVAAELESQVQAKQQRCAS